MITLRRIAVPARQHQAGISLVIVLILLFASVLLGTSAAVIAVQAEKASRGDRDRQSAFQAAEAALIDAQLDIDTAPGGSGVYHRAEKFSPDSALGFPANDQVANCVAGNLSPNQGLCKRALDGSAPSWLAVELADRSANAVSVPYGHFTGQFFPIGKLTLPAAKPRYVIELMPYHQPGMNTSSASFAYRITAIGFGASTDTQVVLQAFYRKEN